MLMFRLVEFIAATNRKGMTLVEVLIGLAVGSIVLAGSFWSVTTFSKQYQVTSDRINIAKNARLGLFMLKRDIRMAGSEYINSPYGTLEHGLVVSDGGDSCCDKIDIIYDRDINTRHRITYHVITRDSKSHLLRDEWFCETTCTSIDAKTIWEPTNANQPVSTDVSNLQFIINRNIKDYF